MPEMMEMHMATLSKRVSHLEAHANHGAPTFIVYIGGGDITQEPIKATVGGVEEVISEPGETERDFWVRVHATACAGRPLRDLTSTQRAEAMKAGEAQYLRYLAAPSHGDEVRVTVW